MSEMIERVAKAIDPLAWVIPEDDYPAERSRRGAKQFAAMSAARRAIEEMREPTKAMRMGIVVADWQGSKDLNWSDGWKIMIDEALK